MPIPDSTLVTLYRIGSVVTGAGLIPETTLAALYSSEGSVMERHHLAQAICLLNTEGCDILESLPRRDYDRALILLRDMILASDLANYFKYPDPFLTWYNSGSCSLRSG